MVQSLTEFSVVIGIDWSNQKHDICLWSVSSDKFEYDVVINKVETLESWIQSIHQRFPDQKIAISLEQKRGPLIFFFMKYDFLILYPINPATVAKYRRAFQPSRAKDDPSDAKILADLLLKHGDKFKAWAPDTSEIRALQQMVELRRLLVQDKVRLTNRLTACLKNYYPQVLDWYRDKDTVVFCEFIRQWPSLADVQTESEETLLQFFTSHHSHYKRRNKQRI